MDPGLPPRPPGKHRFAPKVPSKRKKKASNASEAQERPLLLQRPAEPVNRRQSSKDKGKAPMHPAFIHDSVYQSPTHPAFIHDSVYQSPTHPAFIHDSVYQSPMQYIEPWDYYNTIYPTTLPWRMPPAGNPDILDAAEFGEAAEGLKYDEVAVNHASELGLNPDQISEKIRLLHFQFPQTLPAIKRSATAAAATAKGKGKQSGPVAMNTDAKGSSTAVASQETCSLKELPAGYMGKLLVYKSGAVKLKLGDTLFDVKAATKRSSVEEVAVINTREKECCCVGTIENHAIVTPAVDTRLRL